MISNWYHAVYQNIISKNNIGFYLETYDDSYWGKSCQNSIYENTISQNENGGIFLDIFSKDNIIQSNNIMLNGGYGISLQGDINTSIISNNIVYNYKNAEFECSVNATWDGNYWNRPRLFPYLIYGTNIVNDYEILGINIDWHPRLLPNSIGGG